MTWRLVRPLRAVCLLQQNTRLVKSSVTRFSIPVSRRQSTNTDTAIPLNEDAAAAPISTHSPATVPKLTTHAILLRQPPSEDVSVRIAGNVHSKRTHKKVAFLFVGDGSTYEPVQAVLQPEDVSVIQNGAYVELQGRWVQTQGRRQTHELHVEKVLRVGESDPDVSPLQKKTMTVEHLRSYPHLRLRLPLYSLLTRIRNQVVNSAHNFFSDPTRPEDEALFVQPPLITSSDCEGAGEVFIVGRKPDINARNADSHYHEDPRRQAEKPFFGTPKYLTVSSQLHLEAYSAELGDVWTLSPTFRAEMSDTARHLAEFYMLEAEFRSLTELSELTSKTRRMIQHIANCLTGHRLSKELLVYHAGAKHRSEAEIPPNLEARWEALSGSEWQTITYTEAINELQTASDQNPKLFVYKPTWNSGLQLEHERWIVTNIGNERPVFVTHYPKAQKPFYMLPSSLAAGPMAAVPRETVSCYDLLFPFGTCEVVGGSLREHRLENLIDAMRQKDLLAAAANKDDKYRGNHLDDTVPEADSPSRPEYPFLSSGESLNTLKWYADLRRFGSSPHGGFGMGFDRLLMYLTGVQNVREVVPFPRFSGRADC